ncbi:unnamed protein product [Miscanthus lutarioriparius]|uniref:Uncharacterized protein n=1 Tax=Miscanthus lutarioriparius TaxID=422564 RepID=A0A811PF58_9POAL|nr:unnamed protein product [Miscanthus lutarioriparius]
MGRRQREAIAVSMIGSASRASRWHRQALLAIVRTAEEADAGAAAHVATLLAVNCGGAPLAIDLIARFSRTLPGVGVTQVFSLTQPSCAILNFESYVETTSLSHQHTRTKHWKPKLLSSEKKTLAILGDKSIDSEDPLEHVIDGTSSEEEDATQNHLSLVNKDENQQTMADLFQEVFNPTNMDGGMNSMRSTGAGNYGRMQQIMQMEEDWHAEFLRRYSREQGYSGGAVSSSQ